MRDRAAHEWATRQLFPTHALYHPIDEDLSIHPKKQRQLLGDPDSMGTPIQLRMNGHPPLLRLGERGSRTQPL